MNPSDTYAKPRSEPRSLTFTWEDPMLSAGKGRAMSGIEYLGAMVRGELQGAPIAHLLGIRILEVDVGRVVFAVEPGEQHYNPMGSVHGGLSATLFDSAMGCAVLSTLPAGTFFTTLELKVNFVRAMSRDTGLVRCEASIIHAGSRVATAEARLTGADGKLYGHATTTCMILRG